MVLIPGLILGAIAASLAVAITPADAVQGGAQRLMYVHVPVAWTAYAAFLVVLLASARFLRARTVRSDALARAAAEVGLVATAATLLTGSVWGALTWGSWWVWDARVATTVLMGLVYLIYLSSRAVASGRARTAVAVLGVVGFAVVPLVHFSVVWWRTLHQPPTILSPSLNAPIDDLMFATLMTALAAFTLVAAWLVQWRSARLLADEAVQGSRTPAERGQAHDDAEPTPAQIGSLSR